MPAVAVNAVTGDAAVDGILARYKWASPSLTFGFPTSAAAYGGGYALGESTSNFKPVTDLQASAIRASFSSYTHTVNLAVTELTGAAADRADFRFAQSDKPLTAWTYLPASTAEAGDGWLRGSALSMQAPKVGNYAWLTVLHETGHSFGLADVIEASGNIGSMPASHDSLEFTTMSYHSFVGSPTQGGYTVGPWDFPTTPMLDDIRALQSMYGASFADAGKSVVLSWNPQTGETSINGVGQGEPGQNRVFMTVYTAGAKTTYDLSHYSTGVNIDLQPGHWSTFSTPQLAHLDLYGSDTHRAQGNVANAYYVADGQHNDLIWAALGGAGADTITGNDGDNQITGNGGDDTVDGGKGVDTAFFSGASTDYRWTAAQDGALTIQDLRADTPDGRDILKNIEILRFSDKTVMLDAGKPAPPVVDNPPPAAKDITPGPIAATASKAADVDSHFAADTSSVAVLTYQFFTGLIPTQAGFDYLLSPTSSNPENLSSDFYQSMDAEGRFMSFAVSLGVYGEGRDAFAAKYGEASMADTLRGAYAEIYGSQPSDADVGAMLDAKVDFHGVEMTRAEELQAYAGDGLTAKAALVGWLLSEAVETDKGAYAHANDAFLAAVGDHTAVFHVPLVGSYSSGHV